MEEITLAAETITNDAETAERAAFDQTKKSAARWRAALYLCAAGGVICASTGLTLGAVSYLGLFKNPDAVNRIGNFLIIAAFPLMMAGAHALDKLSRIRSSKKQP